MRPLANSERTGLTILANMKYNFICLFVKLLFETVKLSLIVAIYVPLITSQE